VDKRKREKYTNGHTDKKYTYTHSIGYKHKDTEKKDLKFVQVLLNTCLVESYWKPTDDHLSSFTFKWKKMLSPSVEKNSFLFFFLSFCLSLFFDINTQNNFSLQHINKASINNVCKSYSSDSVQDCNNRSLLVNVRWHLKIIDWVHNLSKSAYLNSTKVLLKWRLRNNWS
jgi:hypothetical protein